jgi:hypothetical protein
VSNQSCRGSNSRRTEQDYDELVEAGTNFTGKIVLARYGMLYRGLKACTSYLVPSLDLTSLDHRSNALKN